MKTLNIDHNAILGSVRGSAMVFRGFLSESQTKPIPKRNRNSDDVTEAEGMKGQTPVAVKRIQLVHVKNHNREEEALRKLNHPNVVKLLHVESDDNFRYIALELCLGSLDQLFLKSDHPRKYKGPTLPSSLTVLLHLALGLEFIHSNKFAHRNIKPQNILIFLEPDSDNAGQNEQVTIKWADFKLSKRVSEHGTFTMSETQASLCWMAPELLKSLVIKEQTITENKNGDRNVALRDSVKSDVFATGCVFVYYLLDGVHPYGSRPVQIQLNIIHEQPSNLPRLHSSKHNYIAGFVQEMLAYKPEERITSANVVTRLRAIIEKRN